MSTEPDNFEPLRRLLALKRHEQPPPGYFERLPAEIRARLRAAGPANATRRQEPETEGSWLLRLWAGLSAKPAWAGAFGVLICGAALTGIFFSQQGELPTEAAAPAMGAWKTEPHAPALALSEALTTPNPATSSTNPVLNVGPSLFDQIGVLGQPASVNYSVGGK
jgi:hypothetical protein